MPPVLRGSVGAGHPVAGLDEGGDPLVVVGRVPRGRADGPVAELLPAGARPAQRALVQCRDQVDQLCDLLVGGRVKLLAAFGHRDSPRVRSVVGMGGVPVIGGGGPPPGFFGGGSDAGLAGGGEEGVGAGAGRPGGAVAFRSGSGGGRRRPGAGSARRRIGGPPRRTAWSRPWRG